MIEYPYFMSARILSRSKNHNAIAAAAYRAGQKLREGDIDKAGLSDHFNPDAGGDSPFDMPKGLAHDYRNRGGVMSNFILLPAGAPRWMAKRSALWNAVEDTEKRKDAQLAREVLKK